MSGCVWVRETCSFFFAFILFSSELLNSERNDEDCRKKRARYRWMGVYLDVWICRYESEFSKALSQWILLTIKGFVVLIYWVVIIKTGINKHCTKNNKGTSFFPFSVFPISRILLFQRSNCKQSIVICMFMSLPPFFFLSHSFVHSFIFFFAYCIVTAKMKPNQTNSVHFKQNG